MTIDHVTIDTLMTWARAHAPYKISSDAEGIWKRRVRLEIAAEWCADPQDSGSVYGIVARAYLAEPRCCPYIIWPRTEADGHECGPLAETRIG
jgi:hypothetical protein